MQTINKQRLWIENSTEPLVHLSKIQVSSHQAKMKSNKSMRNHKIQFPINVKIIFSQCDICEKAYETPESEINNTTSAIPEEELEQREPLLLLCDSCRQVLEI
jgi:hypothetical protein